MSEFFPKLRGVKWATKLVPKIDGRLRVTSVTGIERSAIRAQQPRWKITIEYEFLSEKLPPPPNELQDDPDPVYSDLDTLLGFFLARQTGDSETFLFQGVNDIDDARFTVDAQKIGTGDGANKDFQLVHTIGEFEEVVQNPVGAPTIQFGDGADPGALTDLGNGLWRTTNAPANGVAVTASFRFAYLCKFDEDEIEVENFMAYFWECGSVPLITVKQ